MVGRGTVGFDLAEIAWTREAFVEEHAFVLRTIKTARRRHRWDTFGYDPPFAESQLAKLAALVERWTLDCIGEPHAWDIGLAADRPEKCPEHAVYVNAVGSAICREKELQSRSNLEDRAASELTYHPTHGISARTETPPVGEGPHSLKALDPGGSLSKWMAHVVKLSTTGEGVPRAVGAAGFLS